jgi:hypothetical protein
MSGPVSNATRARLRLAALGATLFVLVAGPVPAFAQANASGVSTGWSPPVRPAVSIPRLDRAPTLEDFLEMKPADGLEGKLLKVDRFTQQQPQDGQPATRARKPTSVTTTRISTPSSSALIPSHAACERSSPAGKTSTTTTSSR